MRYIIFLGMQWRGRNLKPKAESTSGLQQIPIHPTFTRWFVVVVVVELWYGYFNSKEKATNKR